MKNGSDDTRDTVGSIASSLLQKEAESHDPIELERAMHGDYEKNIYECVSRAKKSIKDFDFFVVVTTKRERLMQNVLRNYFYYRVSCPTPEWDQTVYHYHADGDYLEFLWVIPAREVCAHLRDNCMLVAPEERDLLKFVLDFEDGTLDKLCKKLNGEADLVLPVQMKDESWKN